MLIRNGYPPNINKIRAAFPVPEVAVFTYGAVIYNPAGDPIPDHLLIHEKIHEIQQGSDPEAWWNIFIADRDFRLTQELEAYRNQYAFFKRKVKDRNKQDEFLRKIARDLSSPMYGSIINFSDAMKKIKV